MVNYSRNVMVVGRLRKGRRARDGSLGGVSATRKGAGVAWTWMSCGAAGTAYSGMSCQMAPILAALGQPCAINCMHNSDLSRVSANMVWTNHQEC